MHRNAPLTPEGRLRLCNMIEDGWPVAAAAESMRISRQTAHKWWRRYQDAGIAGLEDRSSRPRRCPTKTPDRMERRIVELRRRHQLGPARLAPRVGMPASTFHRVLQRNDVSRLSDLDRKGRIIRRIETTHPGELVHVDVKKQAKIPKGGGWRVSGKKGTLNNGEGGRPRLGYATKRWDVAPGRRLIAPRGPMASRCSPSSTVAAQQVAGPRPSWISISKSAVPSAGSDRRMVWRRRGSGRLRGARTGGPALACTRIPGGRTRTL
jgi:transposase-like protein